MRYIASPLLVGIISIEDVEMKLGRILGSKNFIRNIPSQPNPNSKKFMKKSKHPMGTCIWELLDKCYLVAQVKETKGTNNYKRSKLDMILSQLSKKHPSFACSLLIIIFIRLES